MCVCMCVYMSVCERERPMTRPSRSWSTVMCVCVSVRVCVWERERERSVSVYMCVCVGICVGEREKRREREREREKETHDTPIVQLIYWCVLVCACVCVVCVRVCICVREMCMCVHDVLTDICMHTQPLWGARGGAVLRASHASRHSNTLAHGTQHDWIHTATHILRRTSMVKWSLVLEQSESEQEEILTPLTKTTSQNVWPRINSN